MKSLMRGLFRASGGGAILFLAVMSAGAQAPLLDGTTQSASTARARYEAAMRMQVDSLVSAFQAAYARRDARDISELYRSDASIFLTRGGTVHGREDIRKLYERLFSRLRSLRITIEAVDRKEAVVHVRGPLVARATDAADAYDHSGPLELELRTNSWERLEITVQRGGEFLLLSPLSPTTARRSAITPDTIRVQLTDAAGGAVRDAEVAFSTNGGRGSVTPAFTATDSLGIASAVFVAASLHETDTVIARATMLAREPAIFSFRVFSTEALATARDFIRVTGVRARFRAVLERTIAERRRSMPGVASAAWDEINVDSTVEAAVELLVPLYAERLSIETMRAITAFYESPAAHEFVVQQPLRDELVSSAEQEWSAVLDQGMAEKLKPSRSGTPR